MGQPSNKKLFSFRGATRLFLQQMNAELVEAAGQVVDRQPQLGSDGPDLAVADRFPPVSLVSHEFVWTLDEAGSDDEQPDREDAGDGAEREAADEFDGWAHLHIATEARGRW